MEAALDQGNVKMAEEDHIRKTLSEELWRYVDMDEEAYGRTIFSRELWRVIVHWRGYA